MLTSWTFVNCNIALHSAAMNIGNVNSKQMSWLLLTDDIAGLSSWNITIVAVQIHPEHLWTSTKFQDNPTNGGPHSHS